MKIYIPSMSRSGLDEVLSGPLADMDTLLRGEVAYVVPPAQLPDYADKLAEAWHRDIEVLECEERGIAATRRWIGENARQSGHEKFLMLDDDLRFLIRKSPEVWNLRGADAEEVRRLISWVSELLDEHAHVGISAREGQAHLGVGDERHVSLNTRTLRALAYRTEDFLSVEHGRVEVMEDFDVNLQLLRKGLSNANVAYWAQGQKMTNAPGGCSTYRSHEVHQRSAERLAELHHPFVTLVEKQNKTDKEGFGTRKEVRIQWKKAFASASVA